MDIPNKIGQSRQIWTIWTKMDNLDSINNGQVELMDNIEQS